MAPGAQLELHARGSGSSSSLSAATPGSRDSGALAADEGGYPWGAWDEDGGAGGAGGAFGEAAGMPFAPAQGSLPSGVGLRATRSSLGSPPSRRALPARGSTGYEGALSPPTDTRAGAGAPAACGLPAAPRSGAGSGGDASLSASLRQYSRTLTPPPPSPFDRFVRPPPAGGAAGVPPLGAFAQPGAVGTPAPPVPAGAAGAPAGPVLAAPALGARPAPAGFAELAAALAPQQTSEPVPRRPASASLVVATTPRRASATAASPRGFQAFEQLLRGWEPPAPGPARPAAAAPEAPEQPPPPDAAPAGPAQPHAAAAAAAAAAAGLPAGPPAGLAGARGGGGAGAREEAEGGHAAARAATPSTSSADGSRAAPRELAPAAPAAAADVAAAADAPREAAPRAAPSPASAPAPAAAGAPAPDAGSAAAAAQAGAPAAPPPPSPPTMLENLLRDWAAPALPTLSPPPAAGPPAAGPGAARPERGAAASPQASADGLGHSAPATVTVCGSASEGAEAPSLHPRPSGGVGGSPGRATSAPAERPHAPRAVMAFEDMLRRWDAPQLPAFAAAAAAATASAAGSGAASPAASRSAATSDPGMSVGARQASQGPDGAARAQADAAGAPPACGAAGAAGRAPTAEAAAAPALQGGAVPASAPWQPVVLPQRQGSAEASQEHFRRLSAGAAAVAAGAGGAAAGAPLGGAAPTPAEPQAPLQRQSSADVYQARYRRWSAANAAAAAASAAAAPAREPPAAGGEPRLQRSSSSSAAEAESQSSGDVYQVRGVASLCSASVWGGALVACRVRHHEAWGKSARATSLCTGSVQSAPGGKRAALAVPCSAAAARGRLTRPAGSCGSHRRPGGLTAAPRAGALPALVGRAGGARGRGARGKRVPGRAAPAERRPARAAPAQRRAARGLRVRLRGRRRPGRRRRGRRAQVRRFPHLLTRGGDGIGVCEVAAVGAACNGWGPARRTVGVMCDVAKCGASGDEHGAPLHVLPMAVLFGLRRMPAASADRDAELSGRAPVGSLRGSGLERQSSHRPVEGMRSVELHGGGSLSLAGTLAGAQSLALDLRAPAPPAPEGEPALPFRRGLGSVFANASAPLAGGSARLPPRSPSAELLAAARAGREPGPGAGPAAGPLERQPSGRPAPRAERQDTPAVAGSGCGQWARPAGADGSAPRAAGINGMHFRRGLAHVRHATRQRAERASCSV